TFSGTLQDGGFAGGAGGSLFKIGTGTLRLTGPNFYTGPTVIFDGVLEVDGFITSDTQVNPGGTLSGFGAIFGNVNNFGVVAPGTSPGTLSIIGGNFANLGGTFRAEIGGLVEGFNADLL